MIENPTLTDQGLVVARRKKLRKQIHRVCINILVVLLVVFMLFPFVWTVLTSLKVRVDLYDPGKWFFKPTLENYLKAINYHRVLDYAWNSFIVASITTIIALVVGSLAAYGLARFDFRLKEKIALGILALRMIPPLSLVLPYFLLGQILRILDTVTVLIIAYQLLSITFTVWMMRGFIEAIPKEVEEAALLDGCSRLGALARVVVPMAAPGMFATGILCFTYAWNEFPMALFLTTFKARTVPTTIMFFTAERGVLWGEASAVGVMATLPILIVSIVLQRYIVAGLTFGVVQPSD